MTQNYLLTECSPNSIEECYDELAKAIVMRAFDDLCYYSESLFALNHPDFSRRTAQRFKTETRRTEVDVAKLKCQREVDACIRFFKDKKLNIYTSVEGEKFIDAAGKTVREWTKKGKAYGEKDNA